MNFSTWMKDNPSIHQLPLRQICLPTTHDSAAYALANPMIGEPGLPPVLTDIYNLLPEIAVLVGKLPGLGSQLEAVVSSVEESIKKVVTGLATSTTQSINDQLQAGVRGLDLRIARSHRKFYTYHGLRSVPLAEVLDDLSSFLAATQGEIIYITLGHYQGFEAGSRQEEDLLQEILEALGGYAYVPRIDNGEITNDVWNQTWTQIVTNDGASPQGSKVILVNGEAQQPSGIYWPQPYSPPDSDNQGMAIFGRYTNGTDLANMVTEQNQNSCQAQSGNLPFALYLTLTPQGSNYTEIILASVAEGLEALGRTLEGEGSELLGKIIEAVATVMKKNFSVTTPWTTLEQLSREIDVSLFEMIRTNFAPAAGEANTVSMIYIDFFENSSLVELVVALSTGNLVRAGPQRCP